MNKQKRRIMMLRTVYEGVIEDNSEEILDEFVFSSVKPMIV